MGAPCFHHRQRFGGRVLPCATPHCPEGFNYGHALRFHLPTPLPSASYADAMAQARAPVPTVTFWRNKRLAQVGPHSVIPALPAARGWWWEWQPTSLTTREQKTRCARFGERCAVDTWGSCCRCGWQPSAAALVDDEGRLWLMLGEGAPLQQVRHRGQA